MELEEVKFNIASLTGHAPYLLLLRHLEAVTAETLNNLTSCKTDKEMLQVSRLYQTQKQFLDTMRYIPESLARELEIEKNNAVEAGVGDEYDYQQALPRNRAMLLKNIEQKVKDSKK